MNNERSRQLNLLMIHLAYLNKKVQLGALNRLPELLHVKALINEWHAQEFEKIKIKSRKLETKDGLLEGYSKVAAYLEGLVGDQLSSQANLCEASQTSLLGGVQKSDQISFICQLS